MIRLTAVSDVEGEAGDYLASSGRPWLSIEPISAFATGRWFRMRYRLGLYDRPARPLVSYRRGSQEIGWHLLPGPVLGRAEWIGVAPAEATAIWISPVAEAGQFRFVVEAIEFLSSLDLLRLGWAGDRARFASALGTRLLRWRDEARENFAWATQRAPLNDWPRYRDMLWVDPRLKEFERPRCDWTRTPRVRMFAVLRQGVTARQIDATIATLQDQIYPGWTLSILGGADDIDVSRRLGCWQVDDARVMVRREGCELEGEDDDFVACIALGDQLAPQALACFIEASRRAPEALVFYCDEEIATAAGVTPIFKPDWSPHLQAARPYVGRLMLTALAHARRRTRFGADPLDETMFATQVLRDLEREKVRHIQRFLVRTRTAPGLSEAIDPPRRPPCPPAREPRVTIVMPTRDRPAFLRKSIASLLAKTRYGAFDLVIVDNGSADPRALAVLAAAEKDPRVTLLRSPGSFNFSALCNLGAANARGEVLIFLNNDVEIIDPDWVVELVRWAIDPGIGAVGCKLLYPDGRIQHAGIVLGLGGSCGHFDAGADDAAPGWLGRNHAVHEAAAVTGACLAVERDKFFAVGGFDAIHLPIEFNDIDLCLRLDERGFQTLWTPFARIVHFESASRGKATFRRLDVHAAERAYFRERWADRLRDDPFFHPGLSLYSLSLALG